jgi:hypothetical protein
MDVKRVLLVLRTTTPPPQATVSITVNLYVDPPTIVSAYPTTLAASVTVAATPTNGATIFDFAPFSVAVTNLYRLEVTGLSAIGITNLNTMVIQAGMEFEDTGP